jgi:hypothetical protein
VSPFQRCIFWRDLKRVSKYFPAIKYKEDLERTVTSFPTKRAANESNLSLLLACSSSLSPDEVSSIRLLSSSLDDKEDSCTTS